MRHIRAAAGYACQPASLAGVVVVLALAYSVSVLFLPHTGAASLLWDGAAVVALQVLTVAALALRAYSEPAKETAWRFLAAGVATNLVADLIYSYPDRAAGPAGSALASVGTAPSGWLYLACYPLFAAGLIRMLLPAGGDRHSNRLDGVVMGFTSAAVLCAAWQPGGPIPPLQTLTSNVGSNSDSWLAAAFVLADILLLAILVGAMITSRFHLSPSGTLVWMGILLWGVGDVAYLAATLAGTYVWPSIIDLAWPAGFAAFAVAAALPDGPGTSAQVRRWAARVPVFSALLAAVILIAGLLHDLPWPATLLATCALMLAIGRQFLTLAELDRANLVHAEARTDDLTGLLNRRGIYEALTVRLAAGTPAALLMVDLDGFKDINDTLGHQAGDEMLIAVADRFRRAAPHDAQVARLGGDEFAISLGAADDPAEVAQALLAAIREPARIADVAVRVSASVGIARYPQDAGDIDELLRTADVAMYLAKRDRSVIAHYRAELDPHSREQLALLAELRNAVPAGQLEVRYQPQCRLSDGAITSVEALLRWEHPNRGQLLPSMFIEQAESSGIICELTNYVLDRALSDLRDWLDAGADLNLSVNISGVDLARLDLPDVVSRALERSDVAPERLTLELTETVMTSDAALAKRLVARLQARGIRISMDDFGIGFSSLAQALSLPLDEIKLDRSLVAAAAEPKGRAILRTAVRLARAVGACVVAEGVEDLRALNFLRSIGADYAQGYLIARPMTADQVVSCAATVPPAMSASLAVVSKPLSGRMARHAANQQIPQQGQRSAQATKPRPPQDSHPEGQRRPEGPTGGDQNETTGGADWPSGAW